MGKLMKQKPEGKAGTDPGMIDRLALKLSAKWHSMSFKEQLAAVAHFMLDAVFVAVLAGSLAAGFQGELIVFVALVPIFAVIVYFRFKQARTRWGL